MLLDQWVAFGTIVRKERIRILRIWTQTLLPPVITQTLYFLIFGKFIGGQLRAIHGVAYMDFIIPGLVMMAVINNSFSNVVSSFFSSKFQRNIEELLVSPTSNEVMVAGFISGGLMRGLLVGTFVFFVSCFFSPPHIYHAGIILLFSLLTSVLFSLGGLLNGIFAKNFDDVAFFPNFILTPLTYLGGVFYSIESLPEAGRQLAKLNPIVYIVDGFRYGFLGFSDYNIFFSALLLAALTVVLLFVALFLLKKGTGIKN